MTLKELADVIRAHTSRAEVYISFGLVIVQVPARRVGAVRRALWPQLPYAISLTVEPMRQPLKLKRGEIRIHTEY